MTEAAPGRPADRSERAFAAAIALMLVLLAGGVYLNTIDSPFAFDDQTEVLENTSIGDVSNVREVIRYKPTRPLTNLTYALDFSWSGLNPRGYHVTNILLHVVNVALLFALARRITLDWNAQAGTAAANSLVAGAAAAGLLAAHPMMTEAVVNVSGRAELLSGMFLLASVLAARQALVRCTVRWAILSVVLLVLALAAKELAVVQPLLVLAYDRVLLPGAARDRRWRLTRVHAPVLAALALVASWRLSLFLRVEHPSEHWFFWNNVWLEAEVFSRYLRLLVVPVSQTLIHQLHPISSVLSWRGLVGLANVGVFGLIAWKLRKLWPPVTLGMVWFFLLFIPSAALFVFVSVTQPMSEHRVYVASCGLFIAAGALLGAYWPTPGRARFVAASLAAVVLAILAAAAVARNEVWADPLTLWRDAAKKAPGIWAAQNNYGRALQDIGDCGTAADYYRRAIAIDPVEPRSYSNLASCQQALGQPEQAMQTLREAAQRAPRDLFTWRNIVRLSGSRGDVAELRHACQEVEARFGPNQIDECENLPHVPRLKQ